MSQELNFFKEYLDYYTTKFTDQYNNFYYFYCYQQFCDQKILDLNKELNKLKSDNTNKKILIDRMNDEIEKKNILIEQIQFKQRKPEKIIVKKRKYSDDVIKTNKIKSPKNYNDKLKKYFQINSLEDILKLENEEDKYELIQTNKKFRKLYDLIPSVKEINKLIGMKELKQKTLEIICNNFYKNENNEMQNIMLMGPPGVGKTLSAKLLGKLFYDLGITTNDKFIFLKRHEMIGRFCGDTAIKTNQALMSGKGGVCFIDEVYSLGNKEQRDVFTKECIDTINQFMSENTDTIIMVAGYEKEIKECFLSYNPGLERRFGVIIKINGYQPDELCQIFLQKIENENWKIQNIDINKFFVDNYKEFKFYGGDIEILFRNCKYKSNMRNLREQIDLENDKIIKQQDLIEAFEDFKSLRCQTKDELPNHIKHFYN